MKPDLRAEAARIAEADSFAAKRRVLCPFCIGLAADPKGPFGVAAEESLGGSCGWFASRRVAFGSPGRIYPRRSMR